MDSLTGLLYAYDPTWDEYAILAIDVPATAVEAVINSAVVSDMHMSAESIARLLTDHLAAPTPCQETKTEFAAGAEL